MLFTKLHHLPALALWLQGEADTGAASLLWTMLQTFLALLFVIVLAVVALRVVLPRLNAVAGGGEGMMRVVDRLPLGASHNLYIIEVAGRWLVVGVSGAGVQMISELDPVSAETAEAELEASRAAKPPFGELGQAARDKISQLLKKKDTK